MKGEYIIIKYCFSLEFLEKLVNEKIKEGYIPLGSFVVTNNYYSQAMYKK